VARVIKSSGKKAPTISRPIPLTRNENRNIITIIIILDYCNTGTYLSSADRTVINYEHYMVLRSRRGRGADANKRDSVIDLYEVRTHAIFTIYIPIYLLHYHNNIILYCCRRHGCAGVIFTRSTIFYGTIMTRVNINRLTLPRWLYTTTCVRSEYLMLAISLRPRLEKKI
jgi:hypothetical protein